MSKCADCGQPLNPDCRNVDTGEPIDECFECWQKRATYHNRWAGGYKAVKPRPVSSEVSEP